MNGEVFSDFLRKIGYGEMSCLVHHNPHNECDISYSNEDYGFLFENKNYESIKERIKSIIFYYYEDVECPEMVGFHFPEHKNDYFILCIDHYRSSTTFHEMILEISTLLMKNYPGKFCAIGQFFNEFYDSIEKFIYDGPNHNIIIL